MLYSKINRNIVRKEREILFRLWTSIFGNSQKLIAFNYINEKISIFIQYPVRGPDYMTDDEEDETSENVL
ncbi:hypothetical protein ACFSKI_16245 [Pseudogracilibacillus auburnensis]|uniref:hypothetical protein n=1 Tax=Pseudogracilibacillus auburnensis TaxID=1494959 RepID=UPI000D765457|nr:hypothetical protein [Pseudogracilibacillus auburnensis]